MKQTCPECNRMGTLTDIDPHAYGCPFTEVICHVCDGEGEIDAWCPVCEETVDDSGWCSSCCEVTVAVPMTAIERLGPGRIAA